MNDKIKLFWLSPWTRIKNKITLTWNENKSSVSDSPQVGKNVKFYLDCKIYVAWFIHKKKWSMVFLRGVVQLAFLVSSFYRSNINGYAIRLHITHHSAASLIGHFCTPDHTILHGHVLYSVPKYNASTIVTWERQTNRINRPGYRLFVQFFIVTWWINTSKHAVLPTYCTKTFIKESPLKVILIFLHFNSNGRFIKTERYRWANQRKGYVTENIPKIFMALINYHTTISLTRLFQFINMILWCVYFEGFLQTRWRKTVSNSLCLCA